VDGLREFMLDLALQCDGEDTLEGYAIYTDITEQKEREAALQRQHERLEEFTGIVSHDLRLPLSVAKGNLAIYRDDGPGIPAEEREPPGAEVSAPSERSRPIERPGFDSPKRAGTW
jgi:signal transduction histidine kinase